jgi:hypothetical protein
MFRIFCVTWELFPSSGRLRKALQTSQTQKRVSSSSHTFVRESASMSGFVARTRRARVVGTRFVIETPCRLVNFVDRGTVRSPDGLCFESSVGLTFRCMLAIVVG